ncbi:hypothetical protein HDU96_008055 [Phlyctochytrium bullatum]|nr:hypothetical protein HDU96_008055 [Phlyctochytrium bullatum]
MYSSQPPLLISPTIHKIKFTTTSSPSLKELPVVFAPPPPSKSTRRIEMLLRFIALLLVLATVCNALSIGQIFGKQGDRNDTDYRRDGRRGGRNGRGEGKLLCPLTAEKTGDRLREERDFERFVELIEKEKGLRDEFERNERMTVFAPTNRAVERFEEEIRSRSGRGRDDLNMEDLILYHLVPDQEIDRRDLQDGVLLKTNLEVKELDNARQRIRVNRLFGEVYLNMYARVNTRDSYDAENGQIWALDNVLVPPQNVMEVLYQVPTEFSTSVSALCRLKATEKIEDLKASTLFMPDNDAWEKLGFRNLYYLFGENGREDLKKIMMYHGAEQLAYSTKMMKEETLELESTLKGERLTIEARRRRRDGGRDGGRDDDRDVNRSCRDEERDCLRRGDRNCREERERCERRRRDNRRDNRRRRDGRNGRDEDDEDDRDGQFDSPRDYLFIINDGEARIRFTDALGENGVIHVISDVLIPENVNLPHDRAEARV